MFLVFFTADFLFLLKHKRTKLQIWLIFHGQIAFSYFWSAHSVHCGFYSLQMV